MTLRLTREDGTIDEYECRIGDDMGDDGALIVKDHPLLLVIDAQDHGRTFRSFLWNLCWHLGAFTAAEVITK